MQKVYFHPDCKVQIVDVSGKKPLEDIKKEFGNYEYQTIEINADTSETYCIEEINSVKTLCKKTEVGIFKKDGTKIQIEE